MSHSISECVKKLKEQRKETRAVMQRFEGAADLSSDEVTTYEHLSLSMVILNLLSDHMLKQEFLPRSWEVFTLGSEFDRCVTPLLRTNAQGELWVEYFPFDRPKDMVTFLAGSVADAVPEQAPMMRRRPTVQGKSPRPRTAPAPADSDIMEMIRTRMPDRNKAEPVTRRG